MLRILIQIRGVAISQDTGGVKPYESVLSLGLLQGAYTSGVLHWSFPSVKQFDEAHLVWWEIEQDAPVAPEDDICRPLPSPNTALEPPVRH